MTRLRCCAHVIAAVAACVVGSAVVAAGPDASSSQVHGSGLAKVERLPEVMRLRVQLVAKKQSLTDALAALAERREAVKGVLPTLGALADTVTFESPQVIDGGKLAENYAQLAARMGRTKRGKKGAGPVLPTTATVVLTAEWPLEVADAEELIKVANELQSRIKEADLGGAKEAAQRTPEEEEIMAEIEEMSYSGNEQQPLGVPTFTFVSKIDPKEKARLTAEAFGSAKADAAEIATAAGGRLGRVASINRMATLNPMMAEMTAEWMSYGMRAGYGNPFGTAMPDRPKASDEAMSPTPAKVTYGIQVDAQFNVEFPE